MIFLVILTALLLTPLLLLLVRKLALRLGFVDVPNSRKIHADAVPMIGGLVLYFMAAILLLLIGEIGSFSFYLTLASGLLLVVGLWDDLYQLSALRRFIAQIIACLVIVYFVDLQLNSFGYLLNANWQLQLGIMAIPVTIFGVVGVINALNMADGIDGLAAMTFFSPTLVLAFLSKELAVGLWLMAFLISVMVFVIFNKSNKYKVFLGDNGSMVLGFMLAWLLVYFSQGENAVIKPVTALYLVALPIIDTIFVMLKRILSGHSPFKPDKTHLHHLFLAIGFSQTSTLLVIIFFQGLLIVLGMLFLYLNVPEYYQFYLFLMFSVVYYFGMQSFWKKIK